MKQRLIRIILPVLFITGFLPRLSGQVRILGSGPSTVSNVCSGAILDPGGISNYPNNQDIQQTFCAGGGNCLQLTVTEFETESFRDVLRIYDGTTTTAELLFEHSGSAPSNTVITGTGASGGCLTLTFRSDQFDNAPGFRLNVACVPCPPAPEIVTLGEGNPVINTCSAIIRDPGGTGDYSDNQEVVQTFCSDAGSCPRIVFTEFATETGVDVLRVYDGNSTSSFLLAEYSSGIIPPPVTATAASGGCLTLRFSSNESVNRAGFKAFLNCVACQPAGTNVILGQGSTFTGCSATILDPGGNGVYPPDRNVQQTFCSGSGECVRLTFNSFHTEAGTDILRIYDGPDNFSTLLAELSGSGLPRVYTSSTASQGCLTLAFTSNDVGNAAGFNASLSCATCPPPPDIIVMGTGAATVQTCGGTVLDPGGFGSYSDNQNVTQTICSGSDGCITLTFTDFSTKIGDNVNDVLKVYDGPVVDPPKLLGVYSGLLPPLPVSSSIYSGGCITLQFISDQSLVNNGFAALVSCTPCADPSPIPTGLCADSKPFCANNGAINFPAGTNVPSPFLDPNTGSTAVGCLNSTLNPAWYFMNISESGPIRIEIMGSGDGGATATDDVDFICWGPFATREEICSKVSDISFANDVNNIVDCSYAPDEIEYLNIGFAQEGTWYMLMINNYDNQPVNIIFSQTNTGDPSAGRTNCEFFCDVEATATATTCNPSTNTYSVSGQVTFVNPPSSGTLTIVNSSGGTLTLNAPFTSPVNFSFSDLASNGNINEVSAFFSSDNSCVGAAGYTAPAACSACPVQAQVSGIGCGGDDLTLSATTVAGATYSWTGPNAFTSTGQNPQLSNVIPAMSGTYRVSLHVAANGCSSVASVNVTVHPMPEQPVLASNAPVCEGTALNLTCSSSAIPAATYSWTGPNGFSSTFQNPSINPVSPAAQGQYVCSVTANGCTGPAGMLNVTVQPAPAMPVASNDGPHCAGEQLGLSATVIAGVTYEWRGPVNYTAAIREPSIPNTIPSQGGTYQVRTRLNGCNSPWASTVAVIHPVPPLPVITGNAQVCEEQPLVLSGPPSFTGSPATYAWTGPGSFSASGREIQVAAAAQPVHSGTWSLEVTENGCTSSSGSIEVEVAPIPVADAGPDIESCPGESFRLGVPPVPGNAYAWSPATGLSSATESNPFITPVNNSPGSREDIYTLTVTRGSCQASDQVTVTVTAQPVASFVVPDQQCFNGNSFNFTAGGSFTADARFDWQFGPWATPSSSTEANPSGVSFASTGAHTVTLRITDNGCVSQLYSGQVMIRPIPVANFDASAYSGCSPQFIRFTNLSESEDAIKTYLWSFGDDRIATVANPPVMIFDKAGVYDVSLTLTTQQGCSDTYSVNGLLDIYASPLAAFNLDPLRMNIIDPETHITDMSRGADEVKYIIGGIDTLFKRNALYVFPDTGTYLITQIVSTSEGCRDTVSRTAIVETGYRLYIPTAFTPNNDGFNDYFRIYGEDIREFSMEIYDRWGELLYVSYDYENGWDGHTRLNNKYVPGGIYLYKISTRDKNGIKYNYQGTVTVLK